MSLLPQDIRIRHFDPGGNIDITDWAYFWAETIIERGTDVVRVVPAIGAIGSFGGIAMDICKGIYVP